jgi:hypothetical protein
MLPDIRLRSQAWPSEQPFVRPPVNAPMHAAIHLATHVRIYGHLNHSIGHPSLKFWLCIHPYCLIFFSPHFVLTYFLFYTFLCSWFFFLPFISFLSLSLPLFSSFVFQFVFYFFSVKAFGYGLIHKLLRCESRYRWNSAITINSGHEFCFRIMSFRNGECIVPHRAYVREFLCVCGGGGVTVRSC